jgi:esterase/lipase superfamily enzyme
MHMGQRAIGPKSDKIKTPDVDVDVFRSQIQRMGANRPRMSLFLSQDDRELSLSRFIWGGLPRIGDVNPDQEPYRIEFERDRIEVFEPTSLKSVDNNAHDRAFDEVTSVSSSD